MNSLCQEGEALSLPDFTGIDTGDDKQSVTLHISEIPALQGLDDVQISGLAASLRDSMKSAEDCFSFPKDFAVRCAENSLRIYK